MVSGYCTVEDVRRVLQEADLLGPLDEDDNQIVVDAITGLTETIEKATKRHWYVEGGVDEDDHEIIPDGPNTRDDEHDIPTHGGFVHGASELPRHRYKENSDALLEAGPRHERRRKHDRRPKQEIRIAVGDENALVPPIDESVPAYTRITLARKDVEAVNELHVINEDGEYDDWSEEKEGGVGNTHRGEDYWVRVNNRGRSELYLDVHAMDDDIASFANAVYLDIDYGKDDLPQAVRRGVAMLAAAEIVDDELVAQVPESARYLDIETKAERWERRGVQKLEPHIEREEFLEAYR